MNSLQIHNILSHDENAQKSNFLGCFPIDKIPNSASRYPCSLVINTKPHTHPGEHWVAVIKNEDNYGIYFDSYGFPPTHLPEISKLLNQCIDWTYNTTSLQSQFTTVCGQYVIFFITHYARGFSLEHIIYLLNELGDSYSNDAFIFNYIKNTYSNYLCNAKLKAVDTAFIFNQISNSLQ